MVQNLMKKKVELGLDVQDSIQVQKVWVPIPGTRVDYE